MVGVLDPSSWSWTRRLSSSGQGSYTLEMADPVSGMSLAEGAAMLPTVDAVVVTCWDGVPVYAGLVWQIQRVHGTGRWTLTTKELRSVLFPDRMTFGVNLYTSGDFAYTSRSAAGAVRAILQRATQWSDQWYLPLDLPSDGAGSLSADVARYERRTIDGLLSDVEAQGYEIDMRPYLDGDTLRWQVTVAATISGGSTDLDASAEDSPIDALTVTIDGSEQMTGVHMLGYGTEEDALKSWSGFMGGPSMPVRDAGLQAKSITSQGALDRAALAALTERRYPTEQWSFRLNVNGLGGADLQLGRVLRVRTRGSLAASDGVHALRVIALSGSDSDFVTPEVQPYGA